MLSGAETVHNDFMSPLFLAAVEATEEAIWNALFAAGDMDGFKGYRAEALPVQEVLRIIGKNKR